ncbi:MAG: hypothetical protein ACLGHN_07490 [Bacteriovoracia bacterium]
MAVPKIVWEKQKDSPLQDKKKVEVLIERLNQKIQTNPEIAKKAALIIEQWLKKPKP